VTRPRQSSGFYTAAILVGVVAVLYFARDILIPLSLAITLTLVLSPAVAWLEKLRIGRVAAALLVMFVTISVASGIGYVIFNQLLLVVNDLPSYRENIDRKIQALKAPDTGALGRATRSVKELGKELASPKEDPVASAARARRAATPSNPLPVEIISPPANDLDDVREITQPFLAPLAELGIVLVFTLFLLVEEADLRNRIFRLAGLSRLNIMTEAVEDGTRRVSRYLMLQFLVNAIFGICCGAGLYFIGVPYAALWGTMAGLLRIVPYVGSIVAGLMPLLLSLAVFDGFRLPLLVFALFASLELITGNLIEPWLYGSHTGISSLALLVATVFWAALWGPAGLILATPLTVCVVVLGRYVPQLAFLHILLGDQPVLEPDAQLYQRLLALDDQEARAVTDQYLRETSLPELYDAVIIPALTMAEQDRHKGALDPEREEFLFMSMREMVADYSEMDRMADLEHPSGQSGPAGPERILCFPADDEADEIATVMFAQLLERAGWPAISFPLGTSALNMLSVLDPTSDDIFCISAIPPTAFSHARTLSHELRARFPHTKIVIAVWGFTGDMERARIRFQPSPPDGLVSTIAQALEYFGVPVPAVKQ
jgi:predicted PurR-regulated permease PerM